ncbi:MAG: hypothetical protein ABR936_12000 [Bacteroidota bacterium]|jgi:PBP1b-binding outer membrane lipoprotein LpoB
MKFLIFVTFLILLITLSGCSSSQFATYRPINSEGSQWQIYVNKSFANNFTVTINDSTVIDKGMPPFTYSIDVKSNYKGKEIRLVVNFSPGFFGIGSGYETMVFINNEMVGKFKF